MLQKVTETLNPILDTVKDYSNQTINTLTALFKEYVVNDVFTTWPMKLYNRHIEPLDKKSLMIQAAFALTGLAVILLASPIFGKAFFVTSLVAGVAIGLTGVAWAHHRNKNRLNLEAASEIQDVINKLSKPDNDSNTNFIRVVELINSLKDPKFAHLKDEKEVEGISEHYKILREALNRGNESTETLINEFTTYLKGVVKRLDPKDLISRRHSSEMIDSDQDSSQEV